jgi:Flp pilus assembly secretin CpaC
MSTRPPSATSVPVWRRAGSILALAATLGFAFPSPLLMAQTPPEAPVLDPDKLQAQPRPKPKKIVHRHTATDMVSDDLNRRESERAELVVQQMKAATASEPLPATAPPAVVTASLTPGPVAQGSAPSVQPLAPVREAMPSSTPASLLTQPPVQQVQSVPQTPSPSPVPIRPTPAQLPAVPPIQQVQATPPAPAPAPVPIRPTPAPPPGATPPATYSDAPSRPFGQSQQVPTQQPTLTLEVNKGTALKLPGAASTVFVAAPDIADVQVKSPAMIYVFAKKAGDTVLYAVDAQDHVLLNTIVHVTSPISRMRAGLEAIHPNSGVTFDNQGETIVLGGTVRSAVTAEDARRLALQYVNGNVSKVINNIRVDAPTQVQLRVKVAEVERGSLKRIGINWQNINSLALFGIGPAKIGSAVNTIQSVGGPPSALIAGQSNDGSLTGLIDLLASQSQANVLAEPNLIAMSGETASFLAGGEIPVLAPQASAGGSTIAVTYKQVGVSLAFTPTIVGDRINLKVAPEVSQITTEGQVSVAVGVGPGAASIIIPAISTRRASTTVELGSGQSFAIAGLLQHTSTQTVQKVPALGDIPILGTLFKSDAYQRDETELVIIVTPYFVEPSTGALRTPLTGRVPPTDADRILYQRFNHPTPPATMAVSGGSQPAAGPTAGFKLE